LLVEIRATLAGSNEVPDVGRPGPQRVVTQQRPLVVDLDGTLSRRIPSTSWFSAPFERFS